MAMIKQPVQFKNCPIELAENIWLMGNYFFNLYLVSGAGVSVLIEMGVSAVVDAVIGQLEILGISPDYLVLTHPHTDHITGLPGLMERYPQARVVAGAGAREFARHPKALPAMVAEDRFIAGRLAQEGLVAGRPALESLPFPEDYFSVTDTTDIDLGGLTLRCIPVQGHSPGNIAIHVPERKALFVSDSLGFHYPGRGFCPLFFTGYAGFMQTLDDLEALKPEIVGPAHQGAITGRDVEKAFRQSKAAAIKVLETVRHGKGTDEALARAFFKEYYVEEFTLYREENIMNCCRLLVRRAREALADNPMSAGG